jgi:ankyrin repeat protein
MTLIDRSLSRSFLVNDIFEGFNYYGESCAHILAVQGRVSMLKKFVEHGADVHVPRATGRFFKQSGTLYVSPGPLLKIPPT